MKHKQILELKNNQPKSDVSGPLGAFSNDDPLDLTPLNIESLINGRNRTEQKALPQ